ncbi:MAG: hypothetical protein Q9194_004210 [Teloschistes cf. exilis]
MFTWEVVEGTSGSRENHEFRGVAESATPYNMSSHGYRSSRKRSHSPSVDQASPSRRHRRRRSASPRSHPHHAHAPPQSSVILPLEARPLRKRDLESYLPMFGLYLDIQKQLILEEMEEKEVKGRWKRFIDRWNRGELAEGWYDPTTLRRAQASAAKTDDYNTPPLPNRPTLGEGEDEVDDDFGPSLPSTSTTNLHPSSNARQSGPSIPTLEDLALRRESEAELALQSRGDLRHARKADRTLQKERLEDLAPRAAAGTKDRQLEKRADNRLANSSVAASKSENTLADVPDADLLGDDDGGLEGYKKRKAEEERKKNEREVRREEVLRARREEREERVRMYRGKEAKTMEGLVALAKARFG